MSTLYIMTGIPGAGKTTYAKTLSATRISFDEIKKTLYGNESAFGKRSEIQRLFKKQISDAIALKQDVVIDYQGLTPDSRKDFIQKYGSSFDHVIAVYISTPLDVALSRNANRERHVPENVIKRSALKLITPSTSEGFNEIIIIPE